MKRRLVFGFVALSCLAAPQFTAASGGVAWAQSSSTATSSGTAQPDNPGEYTWSDCIYETGLSDATFIESFTGGVSLTCGGVRHIKSGHGFDNDTEGCIANILSHQYGAVTSDTDPNNWLHRAYFSEGGNEYMQYYQGFVAADKVSLNIVTAYTDTNTYAGDDSWYTCARIAF